MSLAEDFLYVLRIVLEYFGVPPDVVCAQRRTCVILLFCNTQTPEVSAGCLNQGTFKSDVVTLCLCLVCVIVHFSWFQCGIVRCAVSIAALCG